MACQPNLDGYTPTNLRLPALGIARTGAGAFNPATFTTDAGRSASLAIAAFAAWSDALDRLNQVFGDTESAAQPLTQYIAGQVRDRALNPDGSVNLPKMQQVISQYQGPLMHFPAVAKTFSDAGSAQTALNGLQAQQKLFDKFSGALGSNGQDQAGNSVYNPLQFNRAVQDAGPLLDQAYGPQGAAVIRRVNDELTAAAQTPAARVKGQSGSGQVLLRGSEKTGTNGSAMGSLAGTVAGMLVDHFAETASPGGGMAILMGAKDIGEKMGSALSGGQARYQAAIDSVRRQALTDPVYASKLLKQYNPQLPSPASLRALSYVAGRTPGIAAGAGQDSQQNPSGRPTIWLPSGP